MSINRVILVGYLTHDAQVQEIRPGMVKGTLRVATNHTYKDKAGQEVKESCFIDALLWNQQAERCARLRKGDMVSIEGRLKLEAWKDKEGHDKSKHSIAVDKVLFEGKEIEEQAPRASENPFDDLPF